MCRLLVELRLDVAIFEVLYERDPRIGGGPDRRSAEHALACAERCSLAPPKCNIARSASLWRSLWISAAAALSSISAPMKAADP